MFSPIETDYNLDRHLIAFLQDAPFFAEMSRYIRKVPSADLPTAGVAYDKQFDDITLYWNPDFFRSMTDAEVRGVLLHEFYHLVFCHLTSRRKTPPKMWNVATDLAINSIIYCTDCHNNDQGPGAGGTESQDWAEMLLRMYMQWAAKNDYAVELLDRMDDDVAGIQSAAIAVRGPMAYGYLKGETGIHRLVRISPFNSEGKRQTSFAAVDVSPEVNDDIEIKVDWDKDVREETMRAGGSRRVSTTPRKRSNGT